MLNYRIELNLLKKARPWARVYNLLHSPYLVIIFSTIRCLVNLIGSLDVWWRSCVWRDSRYELLKAVSMMFLVISLTNRIDRTSNAFSCPRFGGHLTPLPFTCHILSYRFSKFSTTKIKKYGQCC